MMNRKIYLVTGAAGNLGGSICRQLLEKGERVRALVLPDDPTEKYLPKGVEIVHGDLLDVPSLEVFFRTEEEDEVYVIHCAAIVWERMEMNPKVRAVNVDGTANILNRNNEYDCSKAERELDFHSRPFSESIRDTVNWLREEGFLETPEKAELMEAFNIADENKLPTEKPFPVRKRIGRASCTAYKLRG